MNQENIPVKFFSRNKQDSRLFFSFHIALSLL